MIGPEQKISSLREFQTYSCSKNIRMAFTELGWRAASLGKFIQQSLGFNNEPVRIESIIQGIPTGRVGLSFRESFT